MRLTTGRRKLTTPSPSLRRFARKSSTYRDWAVSFTRLRTLDRSSAMPILARLSPTSTLVAPWTRSVTLLKLTTRRSKARPTTSPWPVAPRAFAAVSRVQATTFTCRRLCPPVRRTVTRISRRRFRPCTRSAWHTKNSGRWICGKLLLTSCCSLPTTSPPTWRRGSPALLTKSKRTLRTLLRDKEEPVGAWRPRTRTTSSFPTRVVTVCRLTACRTLSTD